jgi:RND superfamily putative drug exporter
MRSTIIRGDGAGEQDSAGHSDRGDGDRTPSIWARLGGFAFRRRWTVVIAWVVALLAIFMSAGVIGGSNESAFESPNSEASDGFVVLEDYFGGNGTFLSGSIVFQAEQGVDDPEVQSAMTDLFEEVEAYEGVTVTSPYSEVGAAQGLIAVQGPEAGKIAYAQVEFADGTGEARAATVGHDIAESVDAITVQGLRIEIGGQALAEFEPPESELIGLAFAIVILILAFGSVLAMGLPIGVALAGVSAGAALIVLLSNVMSVPDFAVTLGAMIGLGVGIDYALFIVTRYREGLHAGLDPEEATVVAIDTAGRAVVFAGFTVVISLLGMFVMGLAFINGLATGAAVTVLITMIASVTLLPAFLGFAQRRVEVTRWRGIIAAGLVAVALLGAGLKISPLLIGLPLAAIVLLASFAIAPLRKELPPRREKPLRDTIAYKWSRFVQHRPWPVALGVGALLLAMAVPVFGLRLGFSDESNYAEDTTTRQAYDLITEGFGAGANGPLLLVTEVSRPEDAQRLTALVASIEETEGVAAVAGPIPNDPADPQAAIIRVVPTTGPQDEATDDLVRTLRDDVVPTAAGDSDNQIYVTGSVASQIDFSSYLAQRIPIFFAAVLTLSFLLLMMVFRSLLVPLKAVIMNLLSIGAAYGVVVAIFQWGWGAELFNTSGGPIEPFIPMMMFAIVFGLSMDYEVFLLSRVKEEYDRTGDPVNSVADGLAATARVITAAAAIMVVVFGSFMLEDNRIIKMFGVGLAVAVFIDATLVRMLLVPATMELLGEKNWWLPKWIDRILPTLNVEGGQHVSAITAADDAVADDEETQDRELVNT